MAGVRKIREYFAFFTKMPYNDLMISLINRIWIVGIMTLVGVSNVYAEAGGGALKIDLNTIQTAVKKIKEEIETVDPQKNECKKNEDKSAECSGLEKLKELYKELETQQKEIQTKLSTLYSEINTHIEENYQANTLIPPGKQGDISIKLKNNLVAQSELKTLVSFLDTLTEILELRKKTPTETETIKAKIQKLETIGATLGITITSTSSPPSTPSLEDYIKKIPKASIDTEINKIKTHKDDVKKDIDAMAEELSKVTLMENKISALLTKISVTRSLSGVAENTSQVDMSDFRFWKQDGEKQKNVSIFSESEDGVISTIIRILTRILGTMGIFGIVVGAYFLLTSDGEENRTQRGKTILLYSILGVIIGYMSYAIIALLVSLIFKIGG